MNRSQEEDLKYLYCSIFNQIQECGDIISSILLISKFITENDIPAAFNADRLRSIAVRSVDNDTSTFLWHINALIAASADFEHLLLGIEMMFERFLGNKDVFIKEKEKEKTKQCTIQKDLNSNSNSTPTQTKSSIKTKYIGNEIVSFVQSYYEPNEDTIEDKAPHTPSIDIGSGKPSKRDGGGPARIIVNDENDDTNAGPIGYDANREYMNKYRAQISSPISLRMRQQKRMVQRGRASARNSFIDFGTSYMEPEALQQQQSILEPEVTSPFNVSKFAEAVDLSMSFADAPL